MYLARDNQSLPPPHYSALDIDTNPGGDDRSLKPPHCRQIILVHRPYCIRRRQCLHTANMERYKTDLSGGEWSKTTPSENIFPDALMTMSNLAMKRMKTRSLMAGCDWRSDRKKRFCPAIEIHVRGVSLASLVPDSSLPQVTPRMEWEVAGHLRSNMASAIGRINVFHVTMHQINCDWRLLFCESCVEDSIWYGVGRCSKAQVNRALLTDTLSNDVLTCPLGFWTFTQVHTRLGN